MIAVKILLLLFTGILSVTAGDNEIKIPILGSVIGAVEGAVHSAADAVVEGEQIITRGAVGDIIRNALNRFKALMVDQIELLGLPRLEPLDINHIDIGIKHEIGEFNGTMDNVKILHLSSFDIKDITVHGLIVMDVDLHLFFENLEIFGDYDINANVGDLFHVFGKGPFSLTLYDVDTRVTIKKIKINISTQIVQFDDIGIKVKLGSLSSHFSGLMGGGDSEKLFNKVIEDIAPEAVENLWPEIEPIISAKMKELGNQKLSEVTLKELLELLK